MKSVQKGFTLIELMIVVAIIGILAAVAIPSYQDYTKKGRFAEVVKLADALKQDVAICYSSLNTFTGCSGGAEGVRANLAAATTNTASLTTADGVITGTSAANSDSTPIILTPAVPGADGVIRWAGSGTCLAKGWCKAS